MEVRKGYKQTEVGVIPEDWDTTQISVITSEVGDGIHSTPVYSNNGEYYFINGNNIVNGKVITSQDTKRADFYEFKKYKKILVTELSFFPSTELSAILQCMLVNQLFLARAQHI